MEEKNYSQLTADFFNQFSSEMVPFKKKLNILKIIMISVFALGSLFLYISSLTGEEVLVMLGLALWFASSILIFVIIKHRKKLKNFIKEKEYSFYDDVYIKIIGCELGLGGSAYSYINVGYKKENINVGDILSSRSITLSGVYNGCPVSIKKSREDAVTSIIYSKNTNSTLSFNDKNVVSDIDYTYKIRKNASVPISLGRGFCSNLVKMDNNRFPFIVSCESDVEAYKVLTADFMEQITEWDQNEKIKEIKFEQDNALVVSKSRIIDLDYKPWFTKNIKRNMTKYTADRVLKDAEGDIISIRKFIEASPYAAFKINT